MIFRVAKGDSQLTSSSSRIFGASCLVSAQCAPNRYCWPVWLIGTKSLKNGNLDFGSHLNHSILFHGYFEESPDFGWKRRTDWLHRFQSLNSGWSWSVIPFVVMTPLLPHVKAEREEKSECKTWKYFVQYMWEHRVTKNVCCDQRCMHSSASIDGRDQWMDLKKQIRSICWSVTHCFCTDKSEMHRGPLRNGGGEVVGVVPTKFHPNWIKIVKVCFWSGF